MEASECFVDLRCSQREGAQENSFAPWFRGVFSLYWIDVTFGPQEYLSYKEVFVIQRTSFFKVV